MRSKLLGLVAALVLGGVSSVANAVSVYLEPTSQDVNLGDQFAVELWWDFTGDATLGGGTDIMWDATAFSLVSILFDDNPNFDVAFTRCDDEPCDSPGLIDGLSTGNFNGLAGDGPLFIATITFQTLVEGAFAIALAEDANIAGPFVSATRFDIYPDLEFIGADVNVIGGVVPLPAAAWLLIGGLGTLLGFRRKA
jgi:hypothetical protein